MFSEQMYELGSKRSVIRELFEYGRKRAGEIGADNVYDFTLGNPSIPAPECVKDTIQYLIDSLDPVLLHGYTSAPGDLSVRKAIADYTNETHKTNISASNIYMTSGAAASLSICIRALTENKSCSPGLVCPPKQHLCHSELREESLTNIDEFITFAPFFPEYKVFVESAGAKFTFIPPKEDFQIDTDNFARTLSSNTKAVIINSPNNPSGVVYSEQSIITLCGILKKKSEEYGHPIYLIADEPYRELVYNNTYVPYLLNYYDNTFVCYSYSKSLSLPGERIGYIIVSDKMQDSEKVYLAVCGAGRSLGYVCASSMYQQVIAKCLGQTSDISLYKENRDILYNGLTELGYNCVKPDGAFYLFVKSPEPDANLFCEKAKNYELLLVPGDDFGCPGYVRIAYCVKKEQIIKSMPAFETLMKKYIWF